MKRTWLAVLAAGLGLGAAERPPVKVADVIAPPRIAQVTLSPDGRHMAYTQQEGTVISIIILDLDSGERTPALTEVSQSGFSARVSFLGWANNQALVYAATLPPRGAAVREEVHVVDAAGRNDRTLADADRLEVLYQPPWVIPSPPPGESFVDTPTPDPPEPIPVPRRPRVLGFDAADPDLVLVEATGSWMAPRDVLAIHVGTGAAKRIGEEKAEDRYLYDGHGRACVRETRRVLVEHPPVGLNLHGVRPAEPALQRQFYDVRINGGGWRQLDQITGKSTALHFSREDAEHYQPRSFPIAVDGDGGALIYASNVDRDTYALSLLEFATGTRTMLAESATHDLIDPAQAFDTDVVKYDRQHRVLGVRVRGERPATRWFDAEFEQLQGRLESWFEDRTVEIVAWSANRSRLVALVAGRSDSGRYFLVETQPQLAVTEILRRSRKLTADVTSSVIPFSVTTKDGRRISGRVTRPRWARIQPPPLLVWCRDLPGRVEDGDAFNRAEQTLAAMGYQVLSVDHRGLAGRGRAHLNAVEAGLVQAALDDIGVALDWVAQQHPFDRRRTAWLGEGFGGYLALKAMERFPSRCAVAIEAPIDPAAWLDAVEFDPARTGKSAFRSIPSERVAWRRAYFAPWRAQLARLNLAAAPRARAPSVLLVRSPRHLDYPAAQAEALRAHLRDRGYRADTFEHATGGPLTEAGRVLSRIGGFLDNELFSYRVDIGREEVVK